MRPPLKPLDGLATVLFTSTIEKLKETSNSVNHTPNTELPQSLNRRDAVIESWMGREKTTATTVSGNPTNPGKRVN
jgi:hypothetical protein